MGGGARACRLARPAEAVRFICVSTRGLMASPGRAKARSESQDTPGHNHLSHGQEFLLHPGSVVNWVFILMLLPFV